jgi:hypothetical protein
MRWLAASVAMLAGCVEPALQRCGELLCSADSVCINNSQCATAESIDACKGLGDGMACSTVVFTGTCLDGACTAPRCGDGIVSGSEQCDGPVPSGVDCVTYGFDTGVPACSALCGLEVVDSCVRFGWERVSSTSAEMAWTNGTELAVVPPDKKHVVIYAGAQVIASETTTSDIHALVGHDHTVAVAIDGAILRSDAGAAFAPVALGPIDPGQYEIALDDTGSLFVAIFAPNNARIWKQVGTGAWQNILITTQTVSFMKFVDGFLYAGYESGEVRRWNGAWSGTLFTAPSTLTDIAPRNGAFFIATTSGNYEVIGTALTQIWDRTFPTVAVAGDALYFGGDDIGLLRRTNDGLLEVSDAPIFGRLMTDGTNVFIYGNGIYRYSGTAFARRLGVNEPATDAVLFASGEIGVASLSEVLTVASPENWNRAIPQEPPVALAGRSKTDFYVTGGTVVEHGNGTGLTLVALPPAALPIIEDLAWQDSTSTLFAVGREGLGMKRVGANWAQLASVMGCDFHALALHAPSTVYAVGTCGSAGVIWQLNGNSWTELYRVDTPLRALWVDDADNLYAAGPSGGALRVSGAWRPESGARGLSISATNPSDIWVGGGSDDLIHYDGTAWSRVRIVGAASPHVVATSRSVYIAGATTSVLVR